MLSQPAPDKQPIFEQLDLNDADYALLAASAKRIETLLNLPKVKADGRSGSVFNTCATT